MVKDLAELSDERILIVAGLMEGNPEPMAKHLAAGGELHGDQREALVKYLRGEYRLKRGNRRTYAQEIRERDIRWRVHCLQRHFAILHGSRGSLQRALEAYLDQDPKIGIESLRKYVKRGLSKSELAMIDRVRAEVDSQIR